MFAFVISFWSVYLICGCCLFVGCALMRSVVVGVCCDFCWCLDWLIVWQLLAGYFAIICWAACERFIGLFAGFGGLL